MKWWLYFGVTATGLVQLVALLRLGWVRHGYYATQALENRIVEQNIPSARGRIVDRKGRTLAKSVYHYFRVEDGGKIWLEEGEYEGRKIEGKEVVMEVKRKYGYGEAMGLITGYLGKANDEAMMNNKCKSTIESDDWVGKGGVEEWFECELRGVDGKRLVEVDARGKFVRDLGRAEPEEGGELKLSLDAFWQEKISKLLAGKKGVVIMSEPATGKILAMVSSPSIDPNVFSYTSDNRMIVNYLEDTRGMPLLNRAIAGKYHPGSVFKPVIAAAGLETGVITTSSEYEDTGVIKVGEYSYTNWLWNKSGGTDGMVSIIKAIKRSNDIFFYRLGGDLGLERIDKYARIFGYGQKTGVELPGEVAGLVPDEAWKMEAKGEKWYLGNTYHLSIGQGDLSVTPLQVNQMTNIVATRGKKCPMTVQQEREVECVDLGLKRTTMETIVEGMKQACDNGGTAWPLFNFKTKLACKTGTAEVGDGSKDTHAWLTAFAPADNPEISITVMVERGGEGSDIAAPIVGDILKEWLGEPETLVPRRKE